MYSHFTPSPFPFLLYHHSYSHLFRISFVVSWYLNRILFASPPGSLPFLSLAFLSHVFLTLSIPSPFLSISFFVFPLFLFPRHFFYLTMSPFSKLHFVPNLVSFPIL